MRKVFFWLHLISGTVAAIVIFIMSVTGVILAFERQILESFEQMSGGRDIAVAVRSSAAGLKPRGQGSRGGRHHRPSSPVPRPGRGGA